MPAYVIILILSHIFLLYFDYEVFTIVIHTCKMKPILFLHSSNNFLIEISL